MLLSAFLPPSGPAIELTGLVLFGGLNIVSLLSAVVSTG